MIYWAPFLHFYQPPTQYGAILKKICNESYRPLLNMLREHQNARVTINICGVLTEMLDEHGASDIISSIKELAINNQIEFVGSAKYHAILPLIPKEEMSRQIELNQATNSYFFKEAYKTRGFFPPEMCYSDEVALILCAMGYEWVLVSGIACADKWPLDKIYKAPFGDSQMQIFYRDDIISNKISFHSIDSVAFLSELINLTQGKKDAYIITAMDAETFGHHIPRWEELFLAKVYEMIDANAGERKAIFEAGRKVEIKAVTISELTEIFPAILSKPPKPSSWSSSKEDIAGRNYYSLWKNPHNPLHRRQWEHLRLCVKLVNDACKFKDNKESERFYGICRALLDKALHSCQFWWANKGRTWDINMINRGLMLQEEAALNAYKSIHTSGAARRTKRHLYHEITALRKVTNKIRDSFFKL
ncbi:MAG: hypothetical protein KKH29_03855 [Candidatus Omnitrophica bacterium]|nr:hypothetical protein [Candidatus Omnitrophota bacterium]